MTLKDARKLSGKFPYAIVTAWTGQPVFLCGDKESADMMLDEMWRYCYAELLIVDLRKETNYV